MKMTSGHADDCGRPSTRRSWIALRSSSARFWAQSRHAAHAHLAHRHAAWLRPALRVRTTTSSVAAAPRQVGEIIERVTGYAVSQDTKTVVAGLGKMFVGDLVETARAVMAERKARRPWPKQPCCHRRRYAAQAVLEASASRPQETEPLKPAHIQEALRRLKAAGKATPSQGNVRQPLAPRRPGGRLRL